MMRVFLIIQGVDTCILVSKFELDSTNRMILYDSTGNTYTAEFPIGLYGRYRPETAAMQLLREGFCDLRIHVRIVKK